MHIKRTKIVCTLGPSTDSVSEIKNLIGAGMNVARLNFSHGTYTHHLKIIKNLRIAEKISKKRIAILQDLQGPKIRIGEMPAEGIEIKRGEKVTLTTGNTKGKIFHGKIFLPIQYKRITSDTKKLDRIMIDDGLIALEVEKVSKKEILCKVIAGGIVKTHKGINVPTAEISAPAITAKDKKDLFWGLKQDIDYVALSFVKSKKDIEQLRKILKSAKKDCKIIAKIERREAIENLEEIIKTSDGVIVARGDLGIEIPAEQVPLVQKRIINLANTQGKPVITATQVLQSMVESPIATRAEISDAANAILDNTDAIMLSNETAVGRYPFKACATLSRVAETVERELFRNKNWQTSVPKSEINATCLSACELARDTKADFLVVYTDDGFTAREIAKYRTLTPIITVTPKEKVARELSLVWGLNQIFVTTEKPSGITKFLKQKKVLQKGQKAILICDTGDTGKKEKIISTFKI